NSMFTSVLEKTREIGIMKSLGSTNNEILRLFVIESGLFGLAGGIIGVVLGSIVSIGISLLGVSALGPGQFTTALPPELLIGSIFLSTIIGIVSGIMPARSASQLKPVEALRYE
ncbi:MAG: FtsX-like permease family protein, partial [Candidatus Diapherotrites archaeon]|nr:FtsX-like permease family protein [Candidatus Diapherotrites archaeon]